MKQLLIRRAKYETAGDVANIVKVLKQADIWELSTLDSRSINYVCPGMSGDRLDNVHIKLFSLRYLSLLSALLSEASSWRIETMYVWCSMSAADWATLARLARTGTLGVLDVLDRNLRTAGVEDIRALWGCTHNKWRVGRQDFEKSSGEEGLRGIFALRGLRFDYNRK